MQWLCTSQQKRWRLAKPVKFIFFHTELKLNILYFTTPQLQVEVLNLNGVERRGKNQGWYVKDLIDLLT